MERFSTCDLKQKEVINLCDGSRLGYPTDFEFNLCDGKILSIIVPRPCGFFGWNRSSDLIIPWCKIECIGEDAILVRLSPGECCFPEGKKEKKKKFF